MKNKPRITQFKPGSIKELIVIALPLIIVSLSENIMVFFDRIILSHYSLLALNSITLASQAVEIFQFGLWAITGMSELFVARLYARRAMKDMAAPCWQMIYLSLFTVPIVILLSYYTGPIVLPVAYRATGLAYYQILMYSVPVIGIIAALAGFFVGQGKIKLILYSTIVINLINLFLDYVLIFGFDHLIPAMGASGAAISALVSLIIQMIWLLAIYMNKYYRYHFNTHIMNFNLRYFLKGVKVGLPVSLNHACEMLGWIFIIKVIAQTGLENFTIISIGSTLYLIFSFLNDGLYRSLSTITSYHLSAQDLKAIQKTLFAGFFLLLCFLAVLAIPIIFFPNIVISMFNLKDYAHLWRHDITMSFTFIWIYFLLSGTYWVFGAILTAKLHTQFLMFANILCIWLATALPIYLMARDHTLSPSLIWPLMCIYVFLECIACFIYYKIKMKHLMRGTKNL